MRQLFEAASRLPRGQQQKIAAVLEAFVNRSQRPTVNPTICEILGDLNPRLLVVSTRRKKIAGVASHGKIIWVMEQLIKRLQPRTQFLWDLLAATLLSGF